MYFIEKAEDLVGKTVAFIHAAQFADAITIATTDGGVVVIQQDADEEIHIFKQHQVQRLLFENQNSSKTILPRLQELGIIKENEYADLKEAQRIRREEADRQQSIQKEKRERAELIRLKGKYEGVESANYTSDMPFKFDLKPHVKAAAIRQYMEIDGLTEAEAIKKADEFLSTNETKVAWLKEHVEFIPVRDAFVGKVVGSTIGCSKLGLGCEVPRTRY